MKKKEIEIFMSNLEYNLQNLRQRICLLENKAVSAPTPGKWDLSVDERLRKLENTDHLLQKLSKDATKETLGFIRAAIGRLDNRIKELEKEKKAPELTVRQMWDKSGFKKRKEMAKASIIEEQLWSDIFERDYDKLPDTQCFSLELHNHEIAKIYKLSKIHL